jgi:predicted nucleic acid-binding protein
VGERWVVNASPLIVLARIGRDSLLSALADQVAVPRVVAQEIQAGPKDAAQQALAAGRFAIIDAPPPPTEILAWDLGAGETAVLSFASAEPGWTAILDDESARKCARSLGVDLKGTLGIILLAKQKGLIASAAQELRALRAIGFRIDDHIARDALNRAVGETW